jgi:HAD-hyrolase-like
VRHIGNAVLGNLDTSEAIVVGDSPYDAQAAEKIGLRTIGVLCGGFPETDLRTAGCVAIYRDPAYLLIRFDQSLLGVEVPPPEQTRMSQRRLMLALVRDRRCDSCYDLYCETPPDRTPAGRLLISDQVGH